MSVYLLPQLRLWALTPPDPVYHSAMDALLPVLRNCCGPHSSFVNPNQSLSRPAEEAAAALLETCSEHAPSLMAFIMSSGRVTTVLQSLLQRRGAWRLKVWGLCLMMRRQTRELASGRNAAVDHH